jgi:hypothetical protein
MPPGAWVGVVPVVSAFAAVVWRVVVVVAKGSLEQETSIKARTESAEPNMIALFIVFRRFVVRVIRRSIASGWKFFIVCIVLVLSFANL